MSTFEEQRAVRYTRDAEQIRDALRAYEHDHPAVADGVPCLKDALLAAEAAVLTGPAHKQSADPAPKPDGFVDNWAGAALMDCGAFRELRVAADLLPTRLYCYACRQIEPVARLDEWTPR